jgi:hypothetical protein
MPPYTHRLEAELRQERFMERIPGLATAHWDLGPRMDELCKSQNHEGVQGLV